MERNFKWSSRRSKDALSGYNSSFLAEDATTSVDNRNRLDAEFSVDATGVGIS